MSLKQKAVDGISKVKTYWKTPPAKRYMPFKEIAAYSGGGIGAYMIITMGSACLLATNSTLLSSTLGVDPMDMYIMYVLAVVANIPLTGIRANIIDNTRNKAGKYRPYIVTMAIPSAIVCNILVWFPYTKLSDWLGDGMIFGETKAYIASFAGFAPADDPEITVVIVIDNPKGAMYSGGDIAAPVAGEVFSRILPTMGIEPVYTESELAKLSEPAPDMVGKTVGAAKAELSGTEHVVRVIGSGDTVVSQSPEAGRTTPANGVIVLYTEDNVEKETALVPDFSGLTVSQANQMAVNRGFNIRISGSSFSTDSVVAYKQEYAEGTELELGSIITVYFRTSGISD